jgi:hypothetical protein
VADLAASLLERRLLTAPAAAALSRVVERRALGGLDLSGERFALLGARAELAPTRHLLAAGAEVLWIDVVDPPPQIELGSGTLHWVEGGTDLLAQPGEIGRTIAAFAGGRPVHIGMFAYAAGHGREWRLEAAMNAITHALPRELVASVTIYVSPTSAIAAQPEDARASSDRARTRPAWQRALRRLGVLRPAHVGRGDVTVARAIVPLQGASYQAAQYVAKILVAEVFACGPDETRRVPRVSANVAGITNTSSMSAAVFQAGFLGAPAFGVEVFEPATTRWLSALLMLHDLYEPEGRPDPSRPATLFERQIHGGVYAMADGLDETIRVAALLGLVRRPSLLPGLLRG